ncbi:hypothetical protein Lal_00042414 [Lupinus albus]|nr:hypothetical protein Lal_00042414 [Lupinus albus]
MAPKPKPASVAAYSSSFCRRSLHYAQQHINASAFQNAVKLSDQILAISSSDEDAIRCKIVALIKDDRIDEALSAIRSSPKSLDILVSLRSVISCFIA